MIRRKPVVSVRVVSPLIMTLLGILLALNNALAQELGFEKGKVPAQGYSILLGPQAPEIEVLAAEELRRYLNMLYGLHVGISRSMDSGTEFYLLIGSPATNSAVTRALGPHGWPEVTDQGIVLKSGSIQGKPALIFGGGSPAATLWAVYDFVESTGVRFLVAKDVLPRKATPFPPATQNVVKEPTFRFRAYRGINDLPTSLIFYGLDDYRHLIDQLARMKFNVFYVAIYPFQPFVQYEFRGQPKTTGVLDYGWKLSIHKETIGREVFGGKKEFGNPDIENAQTYSERVQAATGLLRAVFAYAKSRGMKTGLDFPINQFPEEFNHRLAEWSDRQYIPGSAINGLSDVRLGVSEEGIDSLAFPYMTPDNPVVMDLNKTVIRAYVDTYPAVDFYGLDQPELPVSGQEYKRIWARLNSKYALEPEFDLAKMEQSAEQNTLPTGVREGTRPLKELETAITYADTLDKLINEDKVLEKSANPDAMIVTSTFSDEFYPVLAKIFPKHVMQQLQIDYLPSMAAQRTGMLAFAAKTPMKVGVMATMSDDNVGILPQFTAPSLYQISQAMKRYKVYGFFGRNFLVTKLEATTAYLAESSWNPDLTPDEIYRDQIEHVCGEQTVPDLVKAYDILGEATIQEGLVPMGLGFLFPTPDMISKHWNDTSGPVPGWDDLNSYFRRAEPLVESALSKSRPEGKDYAMQIVGQLQFSIDYIDAVQEIRRARVAYHDAQEAFKSKDGSAYFNAMEETNRRLDRALDLLKRAIGEWAAVVRDPSDAGALAALNVFGYDYLKGVAHNVYLESQQWDIHF
jgi:hypothetical protein